MSLLQEGQRGFGRIMSHGDLATPLTLSDFDYHLPAEKIAMVPADQRDQSLLCVMDKSGGLSDRRFDELPQILSADTLLVFNDSAVFSARITHQLPSGKTAEILLLDRPSVAPEGVRCLGRKKLLLKLGELELSGGLKVSFREDAKKMLRVCFHSEAEFLTRWIHKHGITPLPPYIKRQPCDEDARRYQNLYASDDAGSAAAATAGLHFSHRILAELEAKGVDMAFLRLHVSGGTFLPVREQSPADHPMHEESYRVPREVVDKLVEHKKRGSPIVLVGTTTVRALESLGKLSGYCLAKAAELADTWHTTDLLVVPRTRGEVFTPWMGDGLITNFHAPKSTLLMLISALVSYDHACGLYRHALAHNYRMLSYGDSSLVWWS